MFVLAGAGLVFTKTVHTGQKWRLWALQQKAGGAAVWFQNVSWPEMLHLVLPGSGFRIDYGDDFNPDLPLTNPYSSAGDLARAKVLFQQQCATCHGAGARGTGAAPALADAFLARAHDELSTYLVISRGLPGTSMPSHDKLSWSDTWRLAAFVQSIRAKSAPAPSSNGITVDIGTSDLVNAAMTPQNWMMYSGSYNGWRHSLLRKIDVTNVQRLRVKWIHQLPGGFGRQQTVPLVFNGIMYLTFPPANIAAVDAATGRILWSYEHRVPDDLVSCCGRVNRGAALLGKQVFFATIDAHLIALDAATGEVKWERAIADYRDDYSSTAAPLAVNDLIVTGISGADFATRGFVVAYRASDGQPVWRFDTIPEPGHQGNETWSGDSWKTGGASTWMTGSFDPVTNTLYWGTGNPAPQFSGENRTGDNLYSNSVVALDAANGKPRWHFQFTPHDTHGWDSAQVPVLIDNPGTKDGSKLLSWPNRNGFFYSLDAHTGKFIRGQPFARQTWAIGLDSGGRPIVRAGTDPTEQGTLIWPSADGATIWWPPSYDPSSNLLFVPILERPGIYVSNKQQKPKKGQSFLGGAYEGAGKSFYTGIRALDALSGNLVWERRGASRDTGAAEVGGLLSTAGGLVFGSDETLLEALDAKSGRVLWSFDTGAHVIAPPITYAVNEEQLVTVAAGNVLLTFSLAD